MNAIATRLASAARIVSVRTLLAEWYQTGDDATLTRASLMYASLSASEKALVHAHY